MCQACRAGDRDRSEAKPSFRASRLDEAMSAAHSTGRKRSTVGACARECRRRRSQATGEMTAPPALSVFDRQLGVADDFLPPLGIAVDVLYELLRRTRNRFIE